VFAADASTNGESHAAVFAPRVELDEAALEQTLVDAPGPPLSGRELSLVRVADDLVASHGLGTALCRRAIGKRIIAARAESDGRDVEDIQAGRKDVQTGKKHPPRPDRDGRAGQREHFER